MHSFWHSANASLFAQEGEPAMTVWTLWNAVPTELLIAVVVVLALAVVVSSVRVIREDQSGLVIKRFGRPLPSGRIIALDGEAGYQAAMLPPGWHAGLWPWRYKVAKV